MPIKKVTKYECTDGETYDTKEAASLHECVLTLKKEYEKYPLYGKGGDATVDFYNLKDLLLEMRGPIEEYFKLIDNSKGKS